MNWSGERLETNILRQVTLEHLHRYALAREWAEGKKVLDIACGEGYGSALLAATAASVTGVDLDKETISKARQKYQKPNLEFMTGDVTAIPCAAGAFDMVVSFETIEHTGAHETMLSEIKRVLKPGGLLLISTPDKKIYSERPGQKNPFHVKELHAAEFRQLLQDHFLNVSMAGQKLVSCSVILPEPFHAKIYSGDFAQILNKPFEPVYLVAAASDGDLPSWEASFFSADDIMEQALLAQERSFKGSLSYRIGHTLLRPFKWIKKTGGQ